MRFASVLMTAARSGGARDSDVVAWAAAVVANGGTVSPGRAAIVAAFIGAEKDSGAWALTDDYWVLWAENEAQALTSLKQRLLGVSSGSPTFTTDRGYEFNGSTNYINTGFIPSTHGVAYTTNTQRIAVYERTNVQSAAVSAGISVATTNRISIQPRSTSTTMVGQMNTTSVVPTFTISADSRGLSVLSRTGTGAASVTGLGYKNGVRLTDATGLTASANIQNIALFLGGQNSGGSLSAPRACSLGFVSIGGQLSDAQELAQYNAAQTWATAVGAQV